MDFPAPLGPISATRRPGGRSRSRPSSASGPPGWYRTCAPAQRHGHRPGGQRPRRRGFGDRVGRVQHRAIRRAEARACAELERGGGQRGDRLEGGQRGQRHHGQRHPGQRAVAGGGDAEQQDPPQGQPGDGANSGPLPSPAAAAESGLPAWSVPVGPRVTGGQRGVLGAEGVQLGRAGQHVGQGRGQLARGPGPVARAARRAAATAASSGTPTPATSSPAASTPRRAPG